ncbi:unnamed protein product [Amoebophrya sp. A120]|nr:unnamed protein product [Amoebophrya sp. A120]|eukprot:GSA120T00000845001.1
MTFIPSESSKDHTRRARASPSADVDFVNANNEDAGPGAAEPHSTSFPEPASSSTTSTSARRRRGRGEGEASPPAMNAGPVRIGSGAAMGQDAAKNAGSFTAPPTVLSQFSAFVLSCFPDESTLFAVGKRMKLLKANLSVEEMVEELLPEFRRQFLSRGRTAAEFEAELLPKLGAATSFEEATDFLGTLPKDDEGLVDVVSLFQLNEPQTPRTDERIRQTFLEEQ